MLLTINQLIVAAVGHLLKRLRPTRARLTRGVNKNLAILHIHFHLLRKPALLDESLGIRTPRELPMEINVVFIFKM
jgi:hypothetical protein